MAGRTVQKHIRFYMDGYDMSGYARSAGVAGWNFDEMDVTAFKDAARGFLPGNANITIGPLNGLFDSTATSGLHVIASAVEQERIVSVAIGDRAAPAVGVPVFCGQFVQLGYHAEGTGAINANIPFGSVYVPTNMSGYDKPWGHLLLANSAKTGANSDGEDNVDGAAATTAGGYMVYHVFAASSAGHTATIKVQHSADEVDGNFADLGGCTTGVIDVGTAPISGILATTAVTTTVNQYTRWQLTLGTATSVTLMLSFIRG